MYEHRHQQLAAKRIFLRRMRNNLLFSVSILIVSLVVGTLGFYYTSPGADFELIDCFHNAAMLLAGMGPTLIFGEGSQWYMAKLFSAFYALYSGVVLITNIGILLAPALHRFYHRFHLAENE
jgi:hypothetical protein